MIKTFPMRFTEEFHAEIKKAAHDREMSMHSYIILAIQLLNEVKEKEVK